MSDYSHLYEKADFGPGLVFAETMEGVDLPAHFPVGYTIDEFLNRPEPPWLVPGYIPSGLTSFFGEPNIGKSFVALDGALHLAEGSQWLGQPVPQQNVMYWLAEGQGHFGGRLKAWCDFNQLPCTALSSRFMIFPDAMPLQDDYLYPLLKTLERFKTGLVILDTWGLTLPEDENDNSQVNQIIKKINGIKNHITDNIWIIHHVGNASKNRLRGASSLTGALDCAILVAGDTKKGRLSLTCTKQKDAERFDPFNLLIQKHQDSLVIQPGTELHTPTTPTAKPERIPAAEQYAALIAPVIAKASGPISRGEIILATQLEEGVTNKGLTYLLEKGYIIRQGQGKWTRYAIIHNETKGED